MLVALLIYIICHMQNWHTKYIDYRFLAERLRSALFMAVANIEVAPLRPPRHLSLAYSPRDWMVHAFYSAWERRPRFDSLGPSHFEALKNFIQKAWIEDQKVFHQKSSDRHHKRYIRSLQKSFALILGTIIFAGLHLADFGYELLNDIFLFVAISFPTLAAWITATRMHKDFQRNAMRSSEMAHHLTELNDQLTDAHDDDDFIRLLREAEEIMLRENEDWRIVLRFHVPEPPG